MVKIQLLAENTVHIFIFDSLSVPIKPREEIISLGSKLGDYTQTRPGI